MDLMCSVPQASILLPLQLAAMERFVLLTRTIQIFRSQVSLMLRIHAQQMVVLVLLHGQILQMDVL